MTQRIQVLWDNDAKTIIRWDFKGAWTWEDWYMSANRALELRDTVIEHPVVPAIFNLKSSGPVPMGALPHARAAIEMMDQRDYVVLANTSGFVHSLAEIFRVLNSTFAHKVLIARTVEDARTLIAERRAGGEPF
jgi:hypothetical protein